MREKIKIKIIHKREKIKIIHKHHMSFILEELVS